MSHPDDQPGLGTLLRHLLVLMDGDVQALYDTQSVRFRPRYHPVVRALLPDQCLTVTAIAARTGLSQPAITQTLREMRRDGLVTSVPAEDRRARPVRLTPAGRVACKTLAPMWAAVAQAAMALDHELDVPLRPALEAAIAALTNRPFKDRIEERMRCVG